MCERRSRRREGSVSPQPTYQLGLSIAPPWITPRRVAHNSAIAGVGQISHSLEHRACTTCGTKPSTCSQTLTTHRYNNIVVTMIPTLVSLSGSPWDVLPPGVHIATL